MSVNIEGYANQAGALKATGIRPVKKGCRAEGRQRIRHCRPDGGLGNVTKR